jgi:hypothetical protein
MSGRVRDHSARRESPHRSFPQTPQTFSSTHRAVAIGRAERHASQLKCGSLDLVDLGDDQRQAASMYHGCRHGGGSLGSGREYVGLKASLACAGLLFIRASLSRSSLSAGVVGGAPDMGVLPNLILNHVSRVRLLIAAHDVLPAVLVALVDKKLRPLCRWRA